MWRHLWLEPHAEPVAVAGRALGAAAERLAVRIGRPAVRSRAVGGNAVTAFARDPATTARPAATAPRRRRARRVHALTARAIPAAPASHLARPEKTERPPD